MQVTGINIYRPSFYGEYNDRVRKIEDNSSFFSKAYWNAKKTVKKEMNQEIIEYQTLTANREKENERFKRLLEEAKKNHESILSSKKTQLAAIRRKIDSDVILSENLCSADLALQRQHVNSYLYPTIDKYSQAIKQQQEELRNIENRIEEINIKQPEYIQEAKTKHLERLTQLDSDLNNLTAQPDPMLEALKRPKGNGFGSIAGYKTEKETIQNFFGKPVVLNQFGKEAKIPNGILFWGTDENINQKLVIATANQYNCNLIKIDNLEKDDEIIKKLHEAKKIAAENFETKKQQSIIFIPEFDKKIPKYSIIAESLESLLDEISKYHATIFATSANPEKINGILLRKGMFDLKLPINVRYTINDLINILKQAIILKH